MDARRSSACRSHCLALWKLKIALQPPAQRRGTTIGARLIDHAVAVKHFCEYLRVGGLLHLERIETGPHQEMKLVAKHIAGCAQRTAKIEMLAQQARLAIGATIAKFRKVERNQRQMAKPRLE